MGLSPQLQIALQQFDTLGGVILMVLQENERDARVEPAKNRRAARRRTAKRKGVTLTYRTRSILPTRGCRPADARPQARVSIGDSGREPFGMPRAS